MKLLIRYMIILFLAANTIVLPACGQDTQETQKSPAVTAKSTLLATSSATPRASVTASPGAPVENSPVPVPKVTPAPSTVPKQPNITTVSITLALATSQEYTEYTMPIYLRRNERLHFYWAITTGGDHLSLSFTTPEGEFVSVQTGGTFAPNASSTYPDEKLYYNGNIVFTPPQYGWNEGYYLFQPHIRRGDAAVGGKIYYWIENPR